VKKIGFWMEMEKHWNKIGANASRMEQKCGNVERGKTSSRLTSKISTPKI